MVELAIKDRPYDLFVSYSHKDAEFVSRLVNWLQFTAHFNIWIDQNSLQASGMIGTCLPEAIQQARGSLFIISKNLTTSGWAKDEYNAALDQRSRYPDYRIFVVRIDETNPPDFLKTTKWIDMPEGQITPASAYDIISSLYPPDNYNYRDLRDIYISRSWRASEAPVADAICRSVIAAGYRLIGDATNQKVFDIETRVKSIMSSCGAVLAILPNREGKTPKYMEQEIRLANELQIPFFIVAEDGVDVAEDLRIAAQYCASVSQLLNDSAELIETLAEGYAAPRAPHYIFYGASLLRMNSTNMLAKRLVQQITGLECIIGADLVGEHAQKEIIRRISNALFMLADVSDDNTNTLIESGIARGANTRLFLVAKGEPKPTRFMLRDLEINYYTDEIDLLGVIHRLVYPYRRRIVNNELIEQQWFGR